jgi:probable HAF family extracellular repeat protein
MLVVAAGIAGAQATHSYDVVDLGPIGFWAQWTASLDGTGRVAAADDEDDAFVWTAGAVQYLRNLEPTGRSVACDINGAGLVVGQSWVAVQPHAVVWWEGAVIDLGTFGGVKSVANAVNEQGHIVGDFRLAGGGTDEHAFLIGPDGFVDLGTLGGSRSTASGINETGLICGSSRTVSGRTHGVIWIDGVIRDLGTLGASNLDSSAHAINDAGVIVGMSEIFASNDRRAFKWFQGVMAELPNPPGSTLTSAYAINDAGHIVGVGGERAVLWAGDGYADLNNEIDPVSGWILEGATDVDGTGRIVGYGRLNGAFHGFLLEPKL